MFFSQNLCDRLARQLINLINDEFETSEALHGRAKRATPQNYLLYKHAQMLHKLYNKIEPDIEWISLNFQHQLSMQRGHIIVAK